VFKLIKLVIYAAIIAIVVGYFWALPKLDFIHNNPGFCAQLTKNLYYCGDKAQVQDMFKANNK
jgi:hypothetical protein